MQINQCGGIAVSLQNDHTPGKLKISGTLDDNCKCEKGKHMRSKDSLSLRRNVMPIRRNRATVPLCLRHSSYWVSWSAGKVYGDLKE